MKIKSTTLLLATLALLGACKGDPAATTAEVNATPVRSQAATTGPAMPTINTNGVVVTKDEMRLSFKVGGVVKRIAVQEGQEVRKGQVLAEIELTEVNSQVEQMRQMAAKAQRDLQRGESLYADQVISLEQLQDLRTQASVSRAGLSAAQFNRGHAVISAPRDAVVLRKLVEQSELVPAGQTVLLLGARDRGYVVRLGLADREIVQLKLGDSAQIHMDAFPGRSFSGKITEIASAADDKTGMFPAEVRLEPSALTLVSGLVARVSLVPASALAGQLTYVPVAAVVAGDANTASVFLVEGDHARRRSVRVAFMQGTQIALTEGLKPGEIVVTDGALYLEDNEKIAVTSSTGAASALRAAGRRS